MKTYDYTIIGGGIIGCFVAFELSKYDVKVALLEKDADICNETSMANSAIIHCGHDPKDGTLKAKLNVLGHNQYQKLCHDLNVPYHEIGGYVVAYNDDELKTLDELYQNAINRHIEVAVADLDELLQLNDIKRPLKALAFPKTAVVLPWLIGVSLIETALSQNLALFLNTQVTSISQSDDYLIETTNGIFKTKNVINCAGLYAKDIYQMIEEKIDFEISYRKGEYFVLDKHAMNMHSVIYPCPTKIGKGVLFVPTVHGNLLVGPTSVEVASPKDNQTSYDGLNEVKAKINKFNDHVPFNKAIRCFAGIRPTSLAHDFIIEESKHPHFYNLAGIDSPGLASAPAIAQYLVDILKNNNSLKLKDNWQVYPNKLYEVNQLSIDEKNNRYHENSKYANIICRCEHISEQEVINAINALYPSTSIKAIKKRLRPHMGRCQGGFCEPKILNIIKRELNIDVSDVCYDGKGSEIIVDKMGDNHENI